MPHNSLFLKKIAFSFFATMSPLTTQTQALESFLEKHQSLQQLIASNPNLNNHWKTFFTSLAKLGKNDIVDRVKEIGRFLKENGVTYNIYGDPQGNNRTWKLDLIPNLVDADEWRFSEAGLIQRANLFDLILKDIYGDRRLIKEGILPMEIIYNHPGFIRECCGIKLTGKHNLITYSADMARSENGKIWILNDRTQAPSGAGYALENRLAMARVVPELFLGMKVEKLSPHFGALHNALIAIAPQQKRNPRIVILTPGPGNETYFEHSFLSSHLGFTLVQGDDLMVKDNYVWLKTMGGLEQVDVILRRVDDAYCDPLELKEDSQLGIPGLLQAVRSGNVSIANPLGSSVVENPGLIPFLPAVSRFFLSQELLLPTIASWWCGQPKEKQYVLDNLSTLVVKRIYRDSMNRTSVDATIMSKERLANLKQKILANPHLYVGQEKVHFSSSPSLTEGILKPCNALFRSFVVSDNGTYTAMPGGLTRTSEDKNDIIISNQSGGYSKDTWVLSNNEQTPAGNKKEQDFLNRNSQWYKSDYLPSRTAENFFWVGRYAERVLGTARYLRTVMQYVDEANRSGITNNQPLIKCLVGSLMVYTHYYVGLDDKQYKKKLAAPWNLLNDVLLNEQQAGTLSFNFASFNRAVHSERDQWSTDTWRVLRETEDAWKNTKKLRKNSHYKLLNEIDRLITGLMAFISLNRESINREQGWILLDTGRKTEQMLLLITMLKAALVPINDEPIAYVMHEALLKSNENLVNYRYKYKAHLQMHLVLDLLVLDPNNPRSLLHQLERLQVYIKGLPKTTTGHKLSQQERCLLEAYTLLRLAEVDQLSQPDLTTKTHHNLDVFLGRMNDLIKGISEGLTKTYFKHAQKQQQLISRG